MSEPVMKPADVNNMNDVMQALEANRKAYESTSSEAKTAYEKTDKFLQKQEEKNQQLVAEMAKIRAQNEEFKDNVKNLEAKLARPGLSGKSAEYTAEKKAFESYIRKGEKFMTVDELKTLNTESGSDGGFLIPTELDNQITKKIIEISDVRKVARVRPMGKLMRIPIRNNLVTSGWQGEMQTGVTSQSSYGQKELVAKTLMVTVPITRQELEDAAFDMEAQIAEDVATEFARQEGAAFVNGSGNPTTPQGFMTDLTIEFFNSGSATDITMDSILNLPGQLKVGYNPIWAFNRRTKAKIRTLKDSIGNYLWQAGNIAAGVPNMLDGYSYVEWIDMPDIGSGTYPVIFGDFYRGYTIGDRQGMYMIRDDYTLKNQNTVEFQFSKRSDGLVILSEAFKKIKIST